MALVSYVPPIASVRGSLHQTGAITGLICSTSPETGDVVRTRGPGESPGSIWHPDFMCTPQGFRGAPQYTFDRAMNRWSGLLPMERNKWEMLFNFLHDLRYPDLEIGTTAQHLFVSVNIYRCLRTGDMTSIPPATENIPGPAFAITSLTSDGTLFCGTANAPDAPDASLLHFLTTNSRPGQARLFSRNDLRIPTRDTKLSFCTIAARHAAWAITPDAVKIRPGETIGLKTRLLSADFLSLVPRFYRLAIVSHPE